MNERIAACRDPADDRFLELAVNGHADLLLTGDADLLALNPFHGIPVVASATLCTRRRANSHDGCWRRGKWPPMPKRCTTSRRALGLPTLFFRSFLLFAGFRSFARLLQGSVSCRIVLKGAGRQRVEFWYGMPGRSFPRPKYNSCAPRAALSSGPMRLCRHRRKPDISPDWRWRIPMKSIILAELAVLSLGDGVANAQSSPPGNATGHAQRNLKAVNPAGWMKCVTEARCTASAVSSQPVHCNRSEAGHV
jgi:hypothetical protein